MKTLSTLTTRSADARAFLQTFPSDVIAAIVRGEIDLNALAVDELVGRGLDTEARWIGFPEARALSLASALKACTGAVTVTVTDGDASATAGACPRCKGEGRVRGGHAICSKCNGAGVR